jgi:hypothetical protein
VIAIPSTCSTAALLALPSRPSALLPSTTSSRRKRKAHLHSCAHHCTSPALPSSHTACAHGIAGHTCPAHPLCAQSDVPRPGLAALGRRRGRENAPRGTGLRAPIACTNTWATAPLTHHRVSARPSPQLPSASTPSPAAFPQHHRAAADQHGPLFARLCRVQVLRPDFRPWRAQSRKGHGALRPPIPPSGAYAHASRRPPRASPSSRRHFLYAGMRS